MADKTQTLTFKRQIAQPVAEVYRTLTRASAVRTWFCDAAQLDVRPGGRVFLYWNAGYRVNGEFTAVDPNKKLAFTWQAADEPGPTRVQITLKEKDGGTALALSHGGIGAGKKWTAAAEGLAHEWESALDNLKSVLETGEDLRVMRRPMLGIVNMSALDAPTAEKLGVAVQTGIRIGGTVDGMGAQAAGLRADDVIVKMGSHKITSFSSLTSALNAFHAGDEIAVTFHRGAEKLSRPMKLSRRPMPALPADGPALAERVRADYARADAELARIFEGVSEDEAGRRPEPKEWSAKEILAHLIIGERLSQNGYSEMTTDSEPWYDDYDNDLDVWPRALLALHPTVPALLAELKRAQAETVAVLAALPPEFVARRRNYWRMWLGLGLGPTHQEIHAEQMRQAIAAARAG